MTSNEILKADMLDILFDNRNKQYGAYVLRRNYNQRLSVALGISLSTVLLVFILLPKGQSSKKFDRNEGGVVLINPVEIPPEIKKLPPLPVKPPVQTFRQQQFTTTVITEDKIVNITPPDQNQLINSLISNKTIDGEIPTGDISLPKDPPATPVKEEVKNSNIVIVQREPEFPGGQEAWLNFLRKNLIAPTELEPGEKKTVAIRFLVSTDGTVTGFEVLQSAGRLYDNEVIRVLKKMPKWKPAIQNGLAVARAFTQPVSFVGVEE
jgi:protein TonB